MKDRILQLLITERGNIKTSIKYFLLKSRRSLPTPTVHPDLPYIRSIGLPLFAHGVQERFSMFCEVQALFHAFFSVRGIKNLNA